MLHLMKYRLKLCLRDRSSMFWGLCFPLLLSTLFYFTILQGGKDTSILDPVPVALVTTEDAQEETAFAEFLHGLDGDLLEVEEMSSDDADHALLTGKVSGVFTDGETPSLDIAGNEIEESVLRNLLKSYNRNADTLNRIAAEHPQGLAAAQETLQEAQDISTVETVTLGGRSMDGNLQYFFALIAMTCLYGCFLGLRSALESRANLSALGLRRSVTPTHKLALVLSDMFVTFLVQTVNLLLLLLFLTQVLRLDFGRSLGELLLVCALGSMLGVSLGILVGSVGSLPEGAKIAILVSVCLILSFMAGLMVGDMKDIIEQNVPILNRLNPAAVISDALYCLVIYDAPKRLAFDLCLLAGMTGICTILSFIAVRRERYDSL